MSPIIDMVVLRMSVNANYGLSNSGKSLVNFKTFYFQLKYSFDDDRRCATASIADACNSDFAVIVF